MPERPGPWELLDHASDPVVADVAEADSRLTYFRSLAETMRTEGQRLSQIASGESLKGQYADKLRSSAGTVSKDLDQVVGRYEAVVQALGDYLPALDAALVGSVAALDDAIDANAALLAADAMPTATAPSGGQLTAQQEQANTDKTTATDAAADSLNAAKQRLAGVLSALDQAGQTAAATIRQGFNDGLTDSAWDRFKYAFKKFLQLLVKVLTYIGMALAVIALIIPGVGEAIFAAGVALAAVTLAANIALKAMGDGSWADLGIAIAGLLTFGAAKLLGPAIQTGLQSLAGAIRGVGTTGADVAEDVGSTAAGAIEDAGDTATSAGSDLGDAPEDLSDAGEVTDAGDNAGADGADVVDDTAGADGAPAVSPEELEQQIGYLPRAFTRQGDGSMTFTHPDAPGEDLTFLGEDPETFQPQFSVGSTGEKVVWDSDTPGFLKPDGSPADFTSYQGEVPTDHFLVRGFEGQQFTKVDNLDNLAQISDGKTPVLVPTDKLPLNLRGDLDPDRVSSIQQAFQEGKPLPPVGLHPSDLSLSDGNHRIAAARGLGLPFVPVVVA
jgi:ParB-like chromosome segregation protein Spo0J